MPFGKLARVRLCGGLCYAGSENKNVASVRRVSVLLWMGCDSCWECRRFDQMLGEEVVVYFCRCLAFSSAVPACEWLKTFKCDIANKSKSS